MICPSCACSRYLLALTFVPVQTGCERRSRDQQETCSPMASQSHHRLHLLHSHRIRISVVRMSEPRHHRSHRPRQLLAMETGCRCRLACTLKLQGFPWPLSRCSRSVGGYDGIPPTRGSLDLSIDNVKVQPLSFYLQLLLKETRISDYLSTATPTDARLAVQPPSCPHFPFAVVSQVANAFFAFSLAVYISHSYYRMINFCIIAFADRWSLNFLLPVSHEKRLPRP